MSAANFLDGKATAAMVLGELTAAGIDLVATLPDSWLTDLIEAVDADPGMTLIRVTREGEAVGICAGAYLGGRKAAVLAQNAGVLLSVHALAGLAYLRQMPVLPAPAQLGLCQD